MNALKEINLLVKAAAPASTSFDPNHKSPAPQWGYAYKCKRCGTGFGKPNPKWTAEQTRAYMQELYAHSGKHDRMCELSALLKGIDVSDDERKMMMREAYGGKSAKNIFENFMKTRKQVAQGQKVQDLSIQNPKAPKRIVKGRLHKSPDQGVGQSVAKAPNPIVRGEIHWARP